ncbi:MAG: hypothetical protein V7K77_00665 [Nostoc sp.]|uniref:hypothetical protein n=1 Tax=Nostoc sp. TaxID=1180 RepID=UPI002FF95599
MALRPECILYHVWSNSPTPTAKQQRFEVVDAQLNTVDITAKRDRVLNRPEFIVSKLFGCQMWPVRIANERETPQPTKRIPNHKRLIMSSYLFSYTNN